MQLSSDLLPMEPDLKSYPLQRVRGVPYIFKRLVFIIYLFIFIDYAITVVPFFPPLYSPLPCIPLPPAFPPLSSCPWVVHICSLTSPFPILFLTSPCLFCTYHLCFLFPVPLSPLSPFSLHHPPSTH